MPLEWDEEKRTDNLRKHGLDFADAPAVFQSVAAQGTEYERLINIALRAYMAAQQHG